MNDKGINQKIDYESIYDPSLNVEVYIEKLEDLLRKARISIIERRKIMRQKAQEFRERTRTKDVRNR
ncbi:MAG: hypothetical protein ACFFAN_05460 [Promethearchaeota archaeon]